MGSMVDDPGKSGAGGSSGCGISSSWVTLTTCSLVDRILIGDNGAGSMLVDSLVGDSGLVIVSVVESMSLRGIGGVDVGVVGDWAD